MKHYRLLNYNGDMIVEQVESKNCKYCSSAFIVKDKPYWYLIDIDSGLSICSARTMKELEQKYNKVKEKYEKCKQDARYKIQCEKFSKLVLMQNYNERK